MALELLLSVFGVVKRYRQSRESSIRSRCLRVEQLENRSLLAAVADLIAYRPITDHIDYTAHRVPDAVEADPALGPGIRVNGDDDNGNRRPDYLDSTTARSGDNDLVRVDAMGSGTSFVISWTGSLAVWTTVTKSAAVKNGGSVAPNHSVWVEYVSQTQTLGANTSLTLTVNDSTTATTAIDNVVFHSFESIVIAIGGFEQNPKNIGDPRLGVFTMAAALYDEGYDVHVYAHNEIQSTGRGAAYNEVVSAVLNRNVDNVAIVGYSWGGGAEYELSAGLNANRSLAPAGYKLQYTAYIDAIRHYTISSETRLPVATQYHDNFYQRKDPAIRGNSVSGGNNLNVSQTSWGQSLVHWTIDDSKTLQGLLVNKLMTRIIA